MNRKECLEKTCGDKTSLAIQNCGKRFSIESQFCKNLSFFSLVVGEAHRLLMYMFFNAASLYVNETQKTLHKTSEKFLMRETPPPLLWLTFSRI